jgi:DNA-binding transcriptional LysR family regulator
LDWNDLRYFLAIARLGTLAGAARELGVDHTTVGRRLAALETALGARLYTRGPEGYALTEAGAAILPNVEAIAHEVEAIARRATADAKVEGKVRLSVADSVSGYFVAMVSQLQARHPGLVVEIVSGHRLVDIRRGEADLAVRFGVAGDPELVVRKIGRVGWSLYGAPAYLDRRGRPTDPANLSGHDVVTVDDAPPHAPVAQWLAQHAGSVRVVMRGNTVSAVVDAAVAGMGLALLPCFAADQQPGLTRLHPGPTAARDILLVAHPDLVRAARLRVTMDFIAETFTRDRAAWSGELPGSGSG